MHNKVLKHVEAKKKNDSQKKPEDTFFLLYSTHNATSHLMCVVDETVEPRIMRILYDMVVYYGCH